MEAGLLGAVAASPGFSACVQDRHSWSHRARQRAVQGSQRACVGVQHLPTEGNSHVVVMPCP